MRRSPDSDPTRLATVVLLCITLISCTLVYAFYTLALGPGGATYREDDWGRDGGGGGGGGGSEGRGCCKGIEGLELWGDVVKWGTDFKFNRPEECCEACRKMCEGNDGPCLCDSWVFCGDQRSCGDKFGECWLKKQKDPLAPDRHNGGPTVNWTSGLIFGRGQGIIGLETEYGSMHIKIFPDCAPRSVAYILELLTLRHCAGCQFFRAESRGRFWDAEGNHLKNESFGPPYALLQGTLEVQGGTFDKIPSESCLNIRRGSVAWIGSGPEFFISLANHEEWRNQYTVFGSVLHEDVALVEKIAGLPTTSDVWNNVNVSVLEKPVPLVLRRVHKSAA